MLQQQQQLEKAGGRRFTLWIAPLGRIVEQELTAKLEADVTLNFDSLMASDIQGRARSFQSNGHGGYGPVKSR